MNCTRNEHDIFFLTDSQVTRDSESKPLRSRRLNALLLTSQASSKQQRSRQASSLSLSLIRGRHLESEIFRNNFPPIPGHCPRTRGLHSIEHGEKVSVRKPHRAGAVHFISALIKAKPRVLIFRSGDSPARKSMRITEYRVVVCPYPRFLPSPPTKRNTSLDEGTSAGCKH